MEETNIKFVKSIPMFLLMAAPYLIIYVASLEKTKLLSGDVWILLLFAVIFFNMFYPFLLRKMGYTAKQLLFWDMLIKIFHIPMFVVIFLGILMTIMLSFMVIPLAVLFDYIVVLTSSMYGVSGLGKAKGEGAAAGTYRIMMLVFHFIFCLDVVAAVWSYAHVRGQIKQQQMTRSIGSACCTEK